MTHVYVLPVKTAAAIFPLLAIVLFLPIAVYLYRQHGVMARWRTLSVFGFLYYLITALCMTVVPLPGASVNVCKVYEAVGRPQLTPGNTISDIWKEAHHHLTPGALVLYNPAVWGFAFNVVLMMPLGGFLRYHFRRTLGTAAALGFGMSLFYELTQYTGLWGVYDCPYRLADVDDLVANTLGAVIGWLVLGSFVRKVPALDSLDERALANRPVPSGRRLLALLFDIVGMSLLAWVYVTARLALGGSFFDPSPVGWALLFAFALWNGVLPLLMGATPGKRLLLLDVVTTGNARPSPRQVLIRAVIMVIPLYPLLSAVFVIEGAALTGVSYINRVPGVVGVAENGPSRGQLSEGVRILADQLNFDTFTPVAVLLLTLAYAIAVHRHPKSLSVHEMLSGTRLRALPGKRIVRDRCPPDLGTSADDASADEGADMRQGARSGKQPVDRES